MYSENIILRKRRAFVYLLCQLKLTLYAVQAQISRTPQQATSYPSYTDKGFVTFLKLTHSGAKDIGIPEKKALEALFFDTSIIGLGHLDVLSAFWFTRAQHFTDPEVWI